MTEEWFHNNESSSEVPKYLRKHLQAALNHQYPPTYYSPDCTECKMVPCDCTKRKKRKEEKEDSDSEEEDDEDDDDDSENESVAKRVVRLKEKPESKFIPYFLRPTSESLYRLALFQRDPDVPNFWMCCNTTEEARAELVFFFVVVFF